MAGLPADGWGLYRTAAGVALKDPYGCAYAEGRLTLDPEWVSAAVSTGSVMVFVGPSLGVRIPDGRSPESYTAATGPRIQVRPPERPDRRRHRPMAHQPAGRNRELGLAHGGRARPADAAHSVRACAEPQGMAARRPSASPTWPDARAHADPGCARPGRPDHRRRRGPHPARRRDRRVRRRLPQSRRAGRREFRRLARSRGPPRPHPGDHRIPGHPSRPDTDFAHIVDVVRASRGAVVPLTRESVRQAPACPQRKPRREDDETYPNTASC